MGESNRKESEIDHGINDLYLAAARRFEALFDGIPIACFTFDAAGTIYEWNRSAEELWEISAAEAMQTPLADVLRRPPDDPILDMILRRVFEGESVQECEWPAAFADGREKWVLANAFPLRSPNDQINGAVMAALDITGRRQLQHQVESQVLELHEAHIKLEQQHDELAAANAKLEALATTDGLTGLKNHRSFQEFFEQEFRIAKRGGRPLSLLLLDVDNFKKLNDTFGHPAGDEVLRGVGQILTDLARCSDYVARYGGEEFVIVLPDTSAQGAVEAAERFRRSIEDYRFATGTVTASFGCSTIRASDRDRSELTARADAALYASKHAGRNAVTHADRMPQAA